jgi:hypothetical protein
MFATTERDIPLFFTGRSVYWFHQFVFKNDANWIVSTRVRNLILISFLNRSSVWYRRSSANLYTTLSSTHERGGTTDTTIAPYPGVMTQRKRPTISRYCLRCFFVKSLLFEHSHQMTSFTPCTGVIFPFSCSLCKPVVLENGREWWRMGRSYHRRLYISGLSRAQTGGRHCQTLKELKSLCH